MNAKPRALSGVKPTASSLHLGNYIGAIKNWVKMQEDYDSFYFIPDLHAITVDFDPATLAERTRNTVAQYIAAGVDPNESTLYVQSQVPEHAQLAWVLNCITSFGEASRMTQFKDKSQKGGADSSTVGLFAYPMLMAADILLYNANFVPVGEDQRQHLELTRNLAGRFNNRFGEVFTMPEPLIFKETAKIYDLQEPTSKMSKTGLSPNGAIDFSDEPKVVAKKIKSAVTDDGSEIAFDRDNKPGVSNLLTIYSALTDRPIEAIVEEYRGKMYGHLKVDLADIVVEAMTPIRERVAELKAEPEKLDEIIAHGAEKARAIAQDTLGKVYDKVGFLAAAK